MARHRLSPSRVPFTARSRRPALLGGVLGGGAALVIGIASCVVLSTTSVGVHFTFSDKAEAAVIGSGTGQPALTRDLATTGSATPASTPARPAPPASAATGRAASAARSTEGIAAPPAPPPTVSSTPSSAAAPSAVPGPSSVPSQRPTPQPSNPPGDDSCVLVVLCF